MSERKLLLPFISLLVLTVFVVLFSTFLSHGANPNLASVTAAVTTFFGSAGLGVVIHLILR
jgi:hypothetical protein